MFDGVKVFSATKARDREGLDIRVNEWILKDKPQIVDYKVLQSSDSEFHCLSIVFFYKGKP